MPGVGTVFADAPAARSGDRKRLLQQEVEQMVVESKRVGLELDEVTAAVRSQWATLGTGTEGIVTRQILPSTLPGSTA